MEKFVDKKNLSSVILIFLIFKFQNPSRSTFDHSIFCIPPKNFQFEKFQKFIIWKISQFPK